MINITKINPLKDDPRGLAYAFTARKSGYFVVLNTKKGMVRGVHYHKGNSISKSPETFYLVKGKVKVITKNVKSGETNKYEIEENNLIEVPAMIYHEVHALVDSILLEFNDKQSDFVEETIKGKM
jgi:dTDP-4-dehydrorhamnose 3,5-epimerase-like enzyme